MVTKERRLFLVFFFIFFFIGTSVQALEKKIFDEANLFTETEEEKMQEIAASLAEQFELDIVIVTTDDNRGKTSEQYADDFYDENGFGYGETADGMVYLINMDDREVYISTTGKARDLFSDAEIEEILDAVTPYLAEEDFSGSVDVFLDEVQLRMEYLDENIAEEDEAWLTVEEIFIYLGISVFAGGVTVGVMAMYNRGRPTVNEGTYLERETFKITRKIDRHYNTIVMQQKINRSSSSSSSGRSHGGGGRKF